MYFDGTLNLEGAGACVLLIFPQGEQLKYVLQIHYRASNNEAEYEALIHGLRIEVSLGIKRLLAFGDSKVVIEQVNKEWDCVKDTMDAYCVEIHKLEGHFEGIEFQHVQRNNTVAADVLYWFGLLGFLSGQHPRCLLLLGCPPSVQRPGRACQWHGPSGYQRSYF
jgi:ribonuclease HI